MSSKGNNDSCWYKQKKKNHRSSLHRCHFRLVCHFPCTHLKCRGLTMTSHSTVYCMHLASSMFIAVEGRSPSQHQSQLMHMGHLATEEPELRHTSLIIMSLGWIERSPFFLLRRVGISFRITMYYSVLYMSVMHKAFASSFWHCTERMDGFDSHRDTRKLFTSYE